VQSSPRLYVPDLDPAAGSVELPAGEAHHVTRVLRLRPGDDVRVFDGRGREWRARLVHSPKRSTAAVELVAEMAPVPEPDAHVTFAAGILKGDHMDTVFRDATMMGAAAIVPLVTEHVDVPKKAWARGAATERWQRVAVASAKQCGRAVVPEIGEPESLPDLLKRHTNSAIVMFVEPSLQSGAQTGLVPAGPALLLAGPEGGWSAGEVALALAAGAVCVQLGPRTIRADAIAAVGLASFWASAQRR
jgi:16S rRNA (uracil1498-N3)-methyltransferase